MQGERCPGPGAWVTCPVLVCLILACSGDASTRAADGNAGTSTDYSNPLNHSCYRLGECEPLGQRVTAAPPPVCPTLEPSAAQPCAVEGLTCSYGSSVAAYCRRYYECTELVWQMPEALNAVCLSQPAGYCPPEPEPGSDCVVGEIRSIPCEYPQAIGCYCQGNPPDRPGVTGQWRCYGPPRNGTCPELLPNLGDGCARTGQFCSYGYGFQACDAPYADVYCYQGAWEAGSEAICYE